MSWDADLVERCITCGHANEIGSWNYTHNCNQMLACVVKDMGHTLEHTSWFEVLHGLNGKDGSAFLHEVVLRLEAEPNRFRGMNPENGWGSYDTLLSSLRAMLFASNDNPEAVWEVCG